MKYYVYRYLDKNGNIIYVGLTSRPLKMRVKEHCLEELNKETDKIQFILVPNETQMRDRELYYINLYKPKFNISNVWDGLPEIRPDYDGKWIDYPKNGDVKQVEWMAEMLNKSVLKNKCSDYYITISDRRDRIGIMGYKYIRDSNKMRREITVNQNDLFSNNKKLVIDLLSQMIQIVAEIDGVKASNKGNYFNKAINSYFTKYGIQTTKTLYGYEPINCTKEILNMFSQYEYGNSDMELYKSTNHKKSNSIKYIDVDTKYSVRATCEKQLICLDGLSNDVTSNILKYIENISGRKLMIMCE